MDSGLRLAENADKRRHHHHTGACDSEEADKDHCKECGDGKLGMDKPFGREYAGGYYADETQ